MRSPKAVLILDIDGTINPFYARHTLVDSPEKLPGFEEHSIQDERFGDARVFLQTAAIRMWIGALMAEGVELVWGSAWNESSNLILKMLFPEGSEDWPTIVFPEEIDFSPSVLSWKLSTVKEFVEARYDDSVPLIWADDEIFDDAERWINGRAGAGLLIRPDRHRGLTADHLASTFELLLELNEIERREKAAAEATPFPPELEAELNRGAYRNSPDASSGFARVFVHGDNDSALVIDWRDKSIIQRFPDENEGWNQAEAFALGITGKISR